MSVTDNDTGSITAVQAQSLPSHGELNMTGLRTFSYTPRPGFVGTDSFSYRAKDATQAASNPATVLLNVTPEGASSQESDDGDEGEFRKGRNSDQSDRHDDDDDDDDDGDGCHRDGDRRHKKHGKDWDDDGDVFRNFNGSDQDGDEGDWYGGGQKGHWDDDDEDCDDDDDDTCEHDDDDDDDDD